MRFHVRADGVSMTSALRQFTERKIHFALGRFAERVRNVRMQLVDVNGPKGGKEDIECRLQVQLARGGSLIVTERSDDPFAAASRAAQRLSRTISRRLERVNSRRRRAG